MTIISPLVPPSIPPNVEAALQYASRRGWAVLPMRGKKFYTRDGVRIATRDPNIIKQWGWAENVGMACGEPSRTDVFDIDDAEAFAAAGFNLDALAAQRWPQQRHQAGGTCSSSLQDFAAGSFLGANGGRPALRLCCHQRQGDGGSTI